MIHTEVRPPEPSAPARLFGWRGVAHVAARLLLGGILLWAGLSKAFAHQEMVLAVDAYEVLPDALVQPVAAALPWIEILLGLFVLAGLFLQFSAAASATLLLLFLAVMGQAKARGLPIDCGCFGPGGAGDGVGWLDLIRDLPLLAIAVWLAWRPDGPLTLDTYVKAER